MIETGDLAGESQNNRSEMMPRIVDLVRRGNTFLVTGHEFVDGDALGCEIALWHGLRALGKTVHVVNNEPVLERFRFLDRENCCLVADPTTAGEWVDRCDAALVVDNNSWARLKHLEAPLRATEKPVVCIDHHLAPKPFSKLHLVDTSAASTGQIVYDLLRELGVPLNEPIAEAIYTTLCTDTGWFRHSNTTARTFEICAELLRYGVDPERVNAEVNYQDTLPLKLLLARVLAATTVECDGVFSWSYISRAMIDESGVPMAETESFIDELRSLRGVKIVALFKELRAGGIRISLRSRQEYSANAVARLFGGGGHRHASGLTLRTVLPKAIEMVCGEVRRQVAEKKGG